MPNSRPIFPTSANPGDAAAQWLARRDAGLTAEEELEFRQWRQADPRHAAAWKEVDAAWRAFDLPREVGFSAHLVCELDSRRQRRRWRTVAVLGTSLAAAAVVAFLVARPDPSRGIISRPEVRLLADGTRVELNRDAAIEVNFAADRRQVRLIRGEALFTVAHESARPFIVSTGSVDVQAVGTAFAVQRSADAVDVVVTEGRVAVERSDLTRAALTQRDPVLVDAGARLLVPAAAGAAPLEVMPLPPADLARRLAWRGPRLELNSTRLEEAVALLNRENRIRLHVSEASLGDLRLSGVFRADDAEGFVRLLEANYGVRAERQGDVCELRVR